MALKTNIYPAIRNFYFIPFFISFRFTTLITWYNDLFISEYLASAIPVVTKNISSVTFFILFENKSVSSLNLAALFYIFSKMFCILSFLILFYIGFKFCSFLNFCCPFMFKKLTTSISCFLLFPTFEIDTP